MIPYPVITRWTLKDIQDFLSNPTTRENNYYEFKEALIDPKKIRKVYSSFANCDGGYVFWGIQDATLKIVGIPSDSEFLTRINDSVSKNINPKITFEEATAIRVASNRLVYIHYIHGSSLEKRPHVSDGRILIRENGVSIPLLSGDDLRHRFLRSRFFPDQINLLKNELFRIKEENYSIHELNRFYLHGVQSYLEQKARETGLPTFKNLRIQFVGIFRRLTKIDQYRQEVTRTDGPPLDTDDVDNLCREVETQISGFISEFEAAHE